MKELRCLCKSTPKNFRYLTKGPWFGDCCAEAGYDEATMKLKSSVVPKPAPVVEVKPKVAKTGKTKPRKRAKGTKTKKAS